VDVVQQEGSSYVHEKEAEARGPLAGGKETGLSYMEGEKTPSDISNRRGKTEKERKALTLNSLPRF